jgi:hypothetical protein
MASIYAVAQSVQPASAPNPVQLENVVNSFYESVNDQSRLYTGPQYQAYDTNVKGSANLGDAATFAKGTVQYDGFVYTDVPLMYDTYKDVVVVTPPRSSATISLVNERVQSFDLLSRHFIYMEGAKDFNAGFYNELYNGKSQVLVKFSKEMQDTKASDAKLFSAKTQLYVQNKGKYYSVNNENALLGAFSDKKHDLKQYMHDNGMDFKSNPEQTATKVAARYDELVEEMYKMTAARKK